jgi:hypothetical protein
MINERLGNSSGSETDSDKLKADKWAYFEGLVHEIRFNPPIDVAERRQHNANIRARTAGQVALSARKPDAVRPRRKQ